jgi:hypothetical protein
MSNARLPRVATLALGVFVLAMLVAAPALGALPRTYQVKRVDSPSPETDGRFGLGLVNVGDVNGDGKNDLLTGTDKHGTVPGRVFVVSGANGAILRDYKRPETDSTVGSGDRPTGFGAVVGRIPDLGQCSGFSGDPGDSCPTGSSSTTPDGVSEHLVSASGIDVGPESSDLGVVYVFDGKTGALLRRLHMPAADRTEQITSGGNDPRFGRTGMSPAANYPVTAPTPPPSAGASKGDLNGDGSADIVIGATDYSESKATAHPDSPCATQSGSAACTAAGRVYVYSGAEVVGADPTVPLDTPLRTMKNPDSLPDDASPPNPFANSEGFGELLIPLGDVGGCTTDPGPSSRCPTTTNSTADQRPEFVASVPGMDLHGFQEVGEMAIFDGATSSVLRKDESPVIQGNGTAFGGGQNGIVWPALGDAGQGTTPDYLAPLVQFDGDHRAQGRGYLFQGSVAPGSTGFRRMFSILNDPTPQNSEQFGLSTAGFANVAGDYRNEVLVGAMGPHNPATNRGVVNDLHIFDPITEQPLQSVKAPDEQGGENFSTSLAPLGDLNDDGFQDFAAGAGFYDLTRSSGDCSSAPCNNAGRVYIFTSDNSAPPPPAKEAETRAGRTIEIEMTRNSVRRRQATWLTGQVEAFVDQAKCQSGVVVELQSRVPGSLRWATFSRVRASFSGRFRKRFVPSRTKYYRARLAQTDDCLGAISNRERVAVTR